MDNLEISIAAAQRMKEGGTCRAYGLRRADARARQKQANGRVSKFEAQSKRKRLSPLVRAADALAPAKLRGGSGRARHRFDALNAFTVTQIGAIGYDELELCSLARAAQCPGREDNPNAPIPIARDRASALIAIPADIRTRAVDKNGPAWNLAHGAAGPV